MLILTSRTPWRRRPSGLVEIDRSVSLARGLIGCVRAPAPRDVIGTLGTSTTASTLSANLTGQSFSFGANDGMKFGTGWGTFLGNASFTIAAWCYKNSTGVRRVLTSDWDSGGSGQAIFIQINSGDIQFHTADTGGGDASASAGEPAAGVFLLVCRFELGVARRIWVNGKEGTPSSTYVASLRNGAGSRNVGGTGDYVGGIGFQGEVNDFWIWNRALSPAEVWSLYDPSTRWSLYQPLVRRTYIDIGGGGGSTFKSYWIRRVGSRIITPGVI